MKVLIPIILILTALNVKGQNHLLGIKGGINRTNFSPQPVDTNPLIGISAGLTYDYLISEKFYLSSGIFYNQRGMSLDIKFTDEVGNLIGGPKLSTDFIYNYISVPVKAGLNFGNKFYGFSEIGLLPSVLINSKIEAPKFNSTGQPDGTEIIKNNESEFDLAGIAEVGAGYKFVEKYWLYSSVSYIHGFTAIKSPELFKNSKHYGVNLSLGVKVVL